MKNNYNFYNKGILTLKRVSVLSIVLFSIIFQSANAQTKIKNESTDLVNLSIGSLKNNFTALGNSKHLSAEGNFIIKDGSLDELKSFTLKMVLPSTNRLFTENIINDNLDFQLTHVMILPQMGLIHIVGNLELAGVIKRTELDFSYSVNEDQSISLLGTKAIKLSDYIKETKINASTSKNGNEINLVFNLLFKNNQLNYIASN